MDHSRLFHRSLMPLPGLRVLLAILAVGCADEQLLHTDPLDLTAVADVTGTADTSDVPLAPTDRRGPEDALPGSDIAGPADLPGADQSRPPDPCAAVDCPEHAHCEVGTCFCDEGYQRDGMGGCVEPVPPCTPGSCGDKAWCDTVQETCVCKPGFDSLGGDCVPPSNGAPASRPLAEVCARYAQEVVLTASQQSAGGDTSQCLAGEPTREALNDGLRRLNLYRWLAGLEPAWDVSATNASGQECALMQHLHGGLSHDPDPSWQCYTQAGAAAAGSSNLALGIWSIADSVDLYMEDPGVASLGHRRWCLNPTLGETGFGIFDDASCMYSFGSGNQYQPDYVAWPPPGYVPADLVDGSWSFSSAKCSWNDQTTGQAMLVGTGEVIELELENAGGNYGMMGALRIGPAWKLTGEVTITLFGLSCSGQPTDLSYTVKLVNCD